MENTRKPSPDHVAQEWREFKHKPQELAGADTTRLAFADPEFLLRPETRGIRFELEMLKPELELTRQALPTPSWSSAAHVLCHRKWLPRAWRWPSKAVTPQHWCRHSATCATRSGTNNPANSPAWWPATAPGATALTSSPFAPAGGPVEAANRGAAELGAPTLGLNITLPHEQTVNPYVTPSLHFEFHYFAARKMHFLMRAKALVAFPGGYGTMDELFEIITLVQTQKERPVPIILFGSSYWKQLINFELMVEVGTIARQDLDLLSFCDTPQAAWDAIREHYQLDSGGL